MWNGGTGGSNNNDRRYEDGGEHQQHRRPSPEVDAQQMAAVSALAAFSQAAGGFAPSQPSMFGASSLAQSGLAREYSDATATSTGSTEYARQQQQQQSYAQLPFFQSDTAGRGRAYSGNFNSTTDLAQGAYQQQTPYRPPDLEVTYRRPSVGSSNHSQEAGFRRPSPYDEPQEHQFAAARAYQSEGLSGVDFHTQQQPRPYLSQEHQMQHLSSNPAPSSTLSSEQNLSSIVTQAPQVGSNHLPLSNSHNHDPPLDTNTQAFSLQQNGQEEESGSTEQPEEKQPNESHPDPPPIVKVAPQAIAPRGKPEAMAKALAASRIEAERQELEAMEKEQSADGAATEKITPPPPPQPTSKRSPKRATASKKLPKKSPGRKHASPAAASVLYAGSSPRRELLLHEKAPPIKDAEYENLKELMKQFCRVPLLAEFSRPVGLLHPELSAIYSKIVSHPVDLGHVCRGIRRHQYKTCRDVRLDMWRVFANCVKFHSDPNNKEAVPSFVSIALHLREYFNNLWQEYMLPSDLPGPPADIDNEDVAAAYEVLKTVIAKRDEDRQKRLENSGVLILSQQFTRTVSGLLLNFIETGGCVDQLDDEPVFGEKAGAPDKELDIVVQRLRDYQRRLDSISQSATEEYSLDLFYNDLSNCYTQDVLEDNPAMRNRIASRLNRFFWKQSVVLHEANSRGVTQSSIWGNIAATIWARESSKKPYWPALCLGILPPADQREGWHDAVTERNEGRLPEKLRSQLMTAKRRCEHAQKRQSLSYFLVEFLGTHEFIWVRETDIVENFDAKEDPNKNIKPGAKKPRSGRNSAATIVGTENYQRALQECEWANEEFENILQDAFDYSSDSTEDDEDDEEMNYSFAVLAQSDEEADHEDSHGYFYQEEGMDMSDVDEANWLLSHDGLLDTSPTGRKNAKKRTQAMKKKASAKDKKEEPTKKRSRSKEKKKDPRTKERDEKKEQRELEKRRKKRTREREKMLRSEARKKNKRRRSGAYDSDDDERGLNHDKRARATAIVKAYMHRMANEDDNSRSLALGGVMTMPAAMIDSTGLLSMALAFRAAAGELNMPDDGKEELAKANPWISIDAETPKTSAERAENLQKQIELLEKEIGRVRKNTDRRRSLESEYERKRLAVTAEIEADETAARLNHYKKKKKPAAAPSAKIGQTAGDSPGKSETTPSTTKDKQPEVEADEVSERMDGDDATANEIADDLSESVHSELASTEGVPAEGSKDERGAFMDHEEATHDLSVVEAMDVSTET